jgi:hypothetical protein
VSAQRNFNSFRRRYRILGLTRFGGQWRSEGRFTPAVSVKVEPPNALEFAFILLVFLIPLIGTLFLLSPFQDITNFVGAAAMAGIQMTGPAEELLLEEDLPVAISEASGAHAFTATRLCLPTAARACSGWP